MPREPWTILQWCARTCEYTRRRVGEPLAPLFVRNTRIPHIDKLAHNALDTRIPAFAKAVEEASGTAGRLLSQWMHDLNHEALEELALVLALKRGVDAIPQEVRSRLERLGTLKFVLQDIQKRCENIAVPQISAASRAVDILALPLPACGAQAKQKLLDKSVSFGPQLDSLQKQWEKDLLRDSPAQGGIEDAGLHAYLSFDEQCTLVSRELAILTAQIAGTPFPRSLSKVCRKIGDALEHGMLAAVARKKGLPYLHRRSQYLWGMIGEPRWTVKQRIMRGSWWIEHALKQCRFSMLYQGRSVSRPAFWRTWHMAGSTKRGIFVLNQSLLKLLRGPTGNCEKHITGSQVPLLVPPRPWIGLRATTDPLAERDLTLIATQGHSTEGQSTIKQAIESGAMQPHLDGLNRLSQQAWQINREVLHVVNHLGPLEGKELKCSTQWQQALQVARALGSQSFYLPMYLDFRGRSYASSGTILNFMSKDPLRALFLFGEKTRLGPRGLHWLEVHLSNMYGKCKSQSERQKRLWVESNRENIIQSARNPMRSHWWRSAAKPFQTLAACIELRGAWSCADPAEFESQLPIQLDGTCNGLQHLVSLARDERNAEHVNIVKKSNNECGDVYAAVARVASEEHQCIERCMVKDAVMTFFYGASLHGTLDSLRRHGVQAPLAVAESIRECLENMFARERAIQFWLLECARRITGSCRADQPAGTTTVSWTSPLGMPIVQPYVQPKHIAVRTQLQTFYLPSEYHQAPIDRDKQLAGIVANFVHSLDAAHMLATSRALPADVSFVAIHDSFWARAGDVPVLSRVLREQFARLHSKDLLAALVQEWSERYRGFVVLGRVYQDSPFYEKVLWLRSGVVSGHKQQVCLDNELLQWYEGKPPLRLNNTVRWDRGIPMLGTPGKPSVKFWFPLEFPPLPERGTLDIHAVMDSPYFFS